MNVEHSRALRLAASAAGHSESELARHMAQSAVVVSLAPDVAGAVDTATTIVETLRRGPGHVHLDPSDVAPATVAAIVASAGAVAPSTPVSTKPAPHGAVA